MQETPNANRLQIGIFGKRNSGKSSLINAITHQEIAVVSNTPGTTTDPVFKSMEIHPLGAVLFIDTAGIDDSGELGNKRVQQTKRAVSRTDIAIVVCTSSEVEEELRWMAWLEQKQIPMVVVLNKADQLTNADEVKRELELKCGKPVVAVSALHGLNIDALIAAIVANKPKEAEQLTIVGHLVNPGDLVLLVMPQDIQAPKGRLILPQVQVTRDLLDHHCVVVSCSTQELPASLAALKEAPKLIITDSQVFKEVYALKPAESLLTSFSVLFARYKGDIATFVQGAAALDGLSATSRVLIAEACTHVPLQEDIGREKIPALLRKRFGEKIQIEITAGNAFPADLTPYDLVIHCGACMFNRRLVLERIAQAQQQEVPITNYGVCLAHLGGILDKVVY